MQGSPELTRAIPNLGLYFEAAGLNDQEAKTFLRLCAQRTTIPSYPQVLAENRALAERFSDQVEIHPLGYSSDYPEGSETPRRIEAMFIHNPSQPTENLASQEAPQHATEQYAVATVGQQKRLHLLHPGISQRMGWDGIVFSDSADPDAMELQRWTQNPTLEKFILWGVRGAGRDQLPYGYPTLDFTGSSEALASLAMHRMFRPLSIGSIHNSIFASYYVTSPTFPVQPDIDQLVRLHEQMGRPVNYDTAEAGALPLLSPGIYGLPDEEKTGAFVMDHVREDAIFFNPEVAMMHYPKVDNTPSGKSVAEAFKERNAAIKRRLDRLGNTLAETNFDRYDFSAAPEARRLYAAAVDWCDRVEGSVETTRRNIQALPDEIANRQLTNTEFLHTESGYTLNSLMIVGNVRRLALLTSKHGLAQYLGEQIKKELPSAVGSAEFLPLDVFVCAQGLASLIGMRRIAQAKGLC